MNKYVDLGKLAIAAAAKRRALYIASTPPRRRVRAS